MSIMFEEQMLRIMENMQLHAQDNSANSRQLQESIELFVKMVASIQANVGSSKTLDDKGSIRESIDIKALAKTKAEPILRDVMVKPLKELELFAKEARQAAKAMQQLVTSGKLTPMEKNVALDLSKLYSLSAQKAEEHHTKRVERPKQFKKLVDVTTSDLGRDLTQSGERLVKSFDLLVKNLTTEKELYGKKLERRPSGVPGLHPKTYTELVSTVKGKERVVDSGKISEMLGATDLWNEFDSLRQSGKVDVTILAEIDKRYEEFGKFIERFRTTDLFEPLNKYYNLLAQSDSEELKKAGQEGIETLNLLNEMGRKYPAYLATTRKQILATIKEIDQDQLGQSVLSNDRLEKLMGGEVKKEKDASKDYVKDKSIRRVHIVPPISHESMKEEELKRAEELKEVFESQGMTVTIYTDLSDEGIAEGIKNIEKADLIVPIYLGRKDAPEGTEWTQETAMSALWAQEKGKPVWGLDTAYQHPFTVYYKQATFDSVEGLSKHLGEVMTKGFKDPSLEATHRKVEPVEEKLQTDRMTAYLAGPIRNLSPEAAAKFRASISEIADILDWESIDPNANQHFKRVVVNLREVAKDVLGDEEFENIVKDYPDELNQIGDLSENKLKTLSDRAKELIGKLERSLGIELKGGTAIEKDLPGSKIQFLPEEIVRRDMMDIERSQILIAYMPSDVASAGTAMEMMHQYGTEKRPVIGITGPLTKDIMAEPTAPWGEFVSQEVFKTIAHFKEWVLKGVPTKSFVANIEQLIAGDWDLRPQEEGITGEQYVQRLKKEAESVQKQTHELLTRNLDKEADKIRLELAASKVEVTTGSFESEPMSKSQIKEKVKAVKDTLKKIDEATKKGLTDQVENLQETVEVLRSELMAGKALKPKGDQVKFKGQGTLTDKDISSKEGRLEEIAAEKQRIWDELVHQHLESQAGVFGADAEGVWQKYKGRADYRIEIDKSVAGWDKALTKRKEQVNKTLMDQSLIAKELAKKEAETGMTKTQVDAVQAEADIQRQRDEIGKEFTRRAEEVLAKKREDLKEAGKELELIDPKSVILDFAVMYNRFANKFTAEQMKALDTTHKSLPPDMLTAPVATGGYWGNYHSRNLYGVGGTLQHGQMVASAVDPSYSGYQFMTPELAAARERLTQLPDDVTQAAMAAGILHDFAKYTFQMVKGHEYDYSHAVESSKLVDQNHGKELKAAFGDYYEVMLDAIKYHHLRPEHLKNLIHWVEGDEKTGPMSGSAPNIADTVGEDLQLELVNLAKEKGKSGLMGLLQRLEDPIIKAVRAADSAMAEWVDGMPDPKDYFNFLAATHQITPPDHAKFMKLAQEKPDEARIMQEELMARSSYAGQGQEHRSLDAARRIMTETGIVAVGLLEDFYDGTLANMVSGLKDTAAKLPQLLLSPEQFKAQMDMMSKFLTGYIDPSKDFMDKDNWPAVRQMRGLGLDVFHDDSNLDTIQKFVKYQGSLRNLTDRGHMPQFDQASMDVLDQAVESIAATSEGLDEVGQEVETLQERSKTMERRANELRDEGKDAPVAYNEFLSNILDNAESVVTAQKTSGSKLAGLRKDLLIGYGMKHDIFKELITSLDKRGDTHARDMVQALEAAYAEGWDYIVKTFSKGDKIDITKMFRGGIEDEGIRHVASRDVRPPFNPSVLTTGQSLIDQLPQGYSSLGQKVSGKEVEQGMTNVKNYLKALAIIEDIKVRFPDFDDPEVYWKEGFERFRQQYDGKIPKDQKDTKEISSHLAYAQLLRTKAEASGPPMPTTVRTPEENMLRISKALDKVADLVEMEAEQRARLLAKAGYTDKDFDKAQTFLQGQNITTLDELGPLEATRTTSQMILLIETITQLGKAAQQAGVHMEDPVDNLLQSANIHKKVEKLGQYYDKDGKTKFIDDPDKSLKAKEVSDTISKYTDLQATAVDGTKAVLNEQEKMIDNLLKEAEARVKLNELMFVKPGGGGGDDPNDPIEIRKQLTIAQALRENEARLQENLNRINADGIELKKIETLLADEERRADDSFLSIMRQKIAAGAEASESELTQLKMMQYRDSIRAIENKDLLYSIKNTEKLVGVEKRLNNEREKSIKQNERELKQKDRELAQLIGGGSSRPPSMGGMGGGGMRGGAPFFMGGGGQMGWMAKQMAMQLAGPLIGATSIYRMVNQATEAVKAQEVSIVNLRRVFSGANQDLYVLNNNVARLAVEYGSIVQETGKIQEMWARTGKNTAEQIDLLSRTTLLAINTSDIETADDAVKFLNSSILQMGLHWSEAEKLLDSWNKTADRFPAHTKDFAEGYARAGSYAKALNMDIHELNTVISLLVERTGRPGAEVGTALRMLLSNVARPQSLKVMQDFGIRVYELGEYGQQTTTKLRPFTELMTDMSAKYKEMGVAGATASQTILASTLGQARRRNFAIALLDAWGGFDDVMKESTDSIGYSAKKMELTMETLDFKGRQFKAAVQELAVTLGEAGLVSAMKTVLDTGTGLLTWFNDQDKTTRDMISNMLLLTTVMTTLNSVFLKTKGVPLAASLAELMGGRGLLQTLATSKTLGIADKVGAGGMMTQPGMASVFTKALSRDKNAFEELAPMVELATKRKEEFMVASEGLTTAIKSGDLAAISNARSTFNQAAEHSKAANAAITEKTAQLGLAKARALAASVVTIGLVALAAAISYGLAYKKQQEEAAQRDREETRRRMENYRSLEGLIKKQETLNKEKELSAGNASQLERIERELNETYIQTANLFPELITGYDDLGRAKADNIKLSKELADATKEENLARLKSQISEDRESIETKRKKAEAVRKQLADIHKSIETISNEESDMPIIGNKDKSTLLRSYGTERVRLQNLLEEMEKDILDFDNNVESARKLTVELAGTWAGVNNELYEANSHIALMQSLSEDIEHVKLPDYKKIENLIDIVDRGQEAAQKGLATPLYKEAVKDLEKLLVNMDEAIRLKNEFDSRDDIQEARQQTIAISTQIAAGHLTEPERIKKQLELGKLKKYIDDELKAFEETEDFKTKVFFQIEPDTDTDDLYEELRKMIQADEDALVGDILNYENISNLLVNRLDATHRDLVLELENITNNIAAGLIVMDEDLKGHIRDIEARIKEVEAVRGSLLFSTAIMRETGLEQIASLRSSVGQNRPTPKSSAAKSDPYEKLNKQLAITDHLLKMIQGNMSTLDEIWKNNTNSAAYYTSKLAALGKEESQLEKAITQTSSALNDLHKNKSKNADKIRDLESRLQDLNRQLIANRNSVEELTKSLYEFNKANFERGLSEIDDYLSSMDLQLRILMGGVLEGAESFEALALQTAMYGNSLEYLMQQQVMTEARLAEVQRMIEEQTKITQDAARDRAKIGDEEYNRRVNAAHAMVEALLEEEKQLNGKLNDITGKILDVEDALVSYVSAALSKGYQKQLDNEIKRVNELMDAERKRHNEWVENKRKEIEMMREAVTEEDHYQDVEDMEEELAHLREQLRRLQHDDSAWAGKRRMELLEEIAEKEMALYKKNRDWELDQTIKRIEDEIEEEDKKHEELIETWEDELEAFQEMMEELLETVEATAKGIIDAWKLAWGEVGADHGGLIDYLKKVIPEYADSGTKHKNAYINGISGMSEFVSDGQYNLLSEMYDSVAIFQTRGEQQAGVYIGAWEAALAQLAQAIPIYFANAFNGIQASIPGGLYNQDLSKVWDGPGTYNNPYDGFSDDGTYMTGYNAGYSAGSKGSKYSIPSGKSHSYILGYGAGYDAGDRERQLSWGNYNTGDNYGSYSKGGLVPVDGPAYLHAKEMVLPEKYANVMELLARVVKMPRAHTYSASENSGITNQITIDDVVKIENAHFHDQIDFDAIQSHAASSFKRSLHRKGIRLSSK
jgi:TP901 family phage tail tape measure protein